MRTISPTDRQSGNMLHFFREAFDRAHEEGRTKDAGDALELYNLLIDASHEPDLEQDEVWVSGAPRFAPPEVRGEA
jgi:hypothetical protein